MESQCEAPRLLRRSNHATRRQPPTSPRCSNNESSTMKACGGCRERKPEASRLNYRSAEVEEFRKAALNLCGAEPEQCNKVDLPRRDKRPNRAGQAIERA